VLEAMDFIMNKLEVVSTAVKNEEDSYYRKGLDCGWAKLRKYYNLTDETPIYRAAIVLHPLHKYDYFNEK
jgi:hypothetical protein